MARIGEGEINNNYRFNSEHSQPLGRVPPPASFVQGFPNLACFSPSFSKDSFGDFVGFQGVTRAQNQKCPHPNFCGSRCPRSLADWPGGRFRVIAIWNIMIQSVARVSDFGKRISVKSTDEGNTPEVWPSQTKTITPEPGKSSVPVYQMLWLRGFRGHTIPGRGFNLFKPLRRHFRATPFAVSPSRAAIPATERSRSQKIDDQPLRSPPGTRGPGGAFVPLWFGSA